MRKYNIIAVCDMETNQVLMCKRRKEPYKGLFNLVGGKIENGETGEQAAYRELFEETDIGTHSISLIHLMDFTYYSNPYVLEVYVGLLDKAVAVHGDENELRWVDMRSDFFNDKFAGEGNIGHIMANVQALIASLPPALG